MPSDYYFEAKYKWRDWYRLRFSSDGEIDVQETADDKYGFLTIDKINCSPQDLRDWLCRTFGLPAGVGKPECELCPATVEYGVQRCPLCVNLDPEDDSA